MFNQRTANLHSILQREPPSKWEQFWKSPIISSARCLYSTRQVTPPKLNQMPVTVVCISDTHCRQIPIPEGDILIHAGDLTRGGTFEQLQSTLLWLSSQPHRHKIVIAGNHDVLLDPTQDRSRMNASEERLQLDWGSIKYLEDGSTTITYANGRVLNIYGSPKSPKNGNWAFQYPRSRNVWRGTVPLETDILVTHVPPRDHLDLDQFGCDNLLQELWRVQPLLHVFGHVHDGHGTEVVQFDEVQRAYEHALRGDGSLLGLLRLCWALLWLQIFPSDFDPRKRTQLVNAAIVGGMNDEVRRRPTVVTI